MAKQAIKKGAGIAPKKSTLADFKSKRGLLINNKQNEPLTADDLGVSGNADKELEWLIMPPAFQEVTKLPGIPQGYVVSVMGHSNTGKSTLINHAMIAAQRQGLIPVFFDTENAFDFHHAVRMGLQATPVYADVEIETVDPETGEVQTTVENQIVSWEGDFLYYNSVTLEKMYGKRDYSKGVETSKNRGVAVLEDIAYCMEELIEAQENEEINAGLVFIWDSVGSIICYKDYVSKVGNKMWAAAALSDAFGNLINNRIPTSKKVSSKYTNTFIYVNKVWLDSSVSPTGPVMKAKGGAAFHYSSRLQILMGGQLTAGIKRLTAVAKGLTYGYGTETKIKILKNHLTAPHNVCYEGNIISTDTGFIGVNELESYKKTHLSTILKQLQELNDNKDVVIDEQDVDFQVKEEVVEV